MRSLLRLSAVLLGVIAAFCVATLIRGQGDPPQVYATGRVSTPESFGRKAEARDRAEGKVPFTAGDNLPASWDSRAKGWVPPPKNQGSCGSCWDFSGVGAIEISHIKAGWGKADGSFGFSEQYVLDCTRNGGCNGDDNTNPVDVCMKKGLPLVSEYPSYQARPGPCRKAGKLWKIKDWGFCDNGGNGVASVASIKNAIAAYGSVGSAIAADVQFMNCRPGQVFRGSGSRSINHDIVLCGWDDAKSAWLLRNSWGNWCDNGYCWISWGANQVGTEAIWVSVEAAPAPPGPPDPVPPPPDPVPPAPSPSAWPVYDISLTAKTPWGSFTAVGTGVPRATPAPVPPHKGDVIPQPFYELLILLLGWLGRHYFPLLLSLLSFLTPPAPTPPPVPPTTPKTEEKK